MTAPLAQGPAEIDVVIVNWNGGALVRACLASLAAAGEDPAKAVVVVDNASVDGSADGLERPDLRLTVLRNPDNAGFGRACNQGAALGRAPAILFLNPDTEAGPDALRLALAALAQDPTVGVVGAQLVDGVGQVQRMCARRPSAKSLIGQELHLDRLLPGRVPTHFMTEWDHAASGPVDQVMGAFLMIRRSLFERLGGFDERFHVYYEDVDLCARVWDAGFTVRHLAEVTVRHDGQGTTRQVKARRLFYIQRSRILYAAKHHGFATALKLAGATFAFQLPLRLGLALLRRSPREAGQVVHAALLLAGAMPGLLVRLRRAP
ncbi:hypothetical protein AFCDBAGC_1818 [Methylobacterium cerastii]|uniref:Glycosyltransferase 2-like domain-containing protein n=1 Tax=Methylobacterium cerastii TaxID=932741 RepID=A0ABQ4QGS1_9HYPH|nr:glycosyltransferase family 2 protein [Methylobacterium cerastii]TXM95616.1 glycosyltransferase family 2 protein [Methylobacterium sp. WL122]GJD43956.1 hypothetical protein AFCDBAGC_1818 [Methylobacterium cerastii]